MQSLHNFSAIIQNTLQAVYMVIILNGSRPHNLIQSFYLTVVFGPNASLQVRAINSVNTAGAHVNDDQNEGQVIKVSPAMVSIPLHTSKIGHFSEQQNSFIENISQTES